MKHIAKLIRRERLRRSWSQQGLCKGICTVSYLSKIENGTAEPSAEVLTLLLERLGLQMNEQLEADAAQKAQQGYELLLSGCVDEAQMLIQNLDHSAYAATEHALDLQLLACFLSGKPQPLHEALEPGMDSRQLALQRILQGRVEEAVQLLPCAFTHYHAGAKLYHGGNYASALEHLHTGCDLAAASGALRLMLDCRLLMGNCYNNLRNTALMQRHYEAANRMAAALKDENALQSIVYNTAASQLENGRYEEAYAFFSKQKMADAMHLHKLAICCEKTGRHAEALRALDEAQVLKRSDIAPDLLAEMLDLVRYRLLHTDHLSHDAYGAQLLHCFRRCQKELPHGYAMFHKPWVVEWYAATRQYKKICELEGVFPEKQN